MIYLHLLLTFFKIGAFTFGGGYAMLPLIQEEVLKNGWLPLEDIINFIIKLKFKKIYFGGILLCQKKF